ncbi:MAG: hypothetical protein JRH20_12390 [Deltaproteobacteria bacterium]|nr:hypothetical protein [Deltaproteobacteria bacterium]
MSSLRQSVEVNDHPRLWLTLNDHPRLWLTQADVPRLRSWATSKNPMWRDAIAPLAERAKRAMDDGTVPGADGGGTSWEEYPTEMYASFFAFLSLVHPDEAARADYARRARELLMHVMNLVAAGGSGPFRNSIFSTNDRSRYYGEAFPLTVDWIYPHLSSSDKATIHAVFSGWVDDNLNGGTTTSDHPEPVGMTNNEQLVADPIITRWSANNYYLAHMRNLGLMGLSMDPADDPDGKLKQGFESAVGAFLYVNDHFRRTDGRGGLSPEGPYYAPESVSYLAQWLFALHTSGRDDIAKYGRHAAIATQPYWTDILLAWSHLYPPVPRVREAWEGPVWEAAWSCDGSREYIPDPIAIFGPLGIYFARTGNTVPLELTRWIQENFPWGGPEKLTERASQGDPISASMLYFMLFEPGYEKPSDPRPRLFPRTYLAEGIGHLFSRTGWDDQSSFLRFICGWLSVDHQHGDGNHFGLWRKGEWLTKDRTGYGEENPHSGYHNTLAIKNEEGDNSEAWSRSNAQAGSQWPLIPAGDGKLLRHSSGKTLLYALGDSTALYNSTLLSMSDVVHASRSLVWIKPDHVVLYDRAESKTEGRFKRFWMQLPSNAVVQGKSIGATTLGGQELFVTTVLPEDATLEVASSGGNPAPNVLMTHRLKVETPSPRLRERFLHVVQGGDSGATRDAPTLIRSTSTPAYVGVVVAKTAVLFPAEFPTATGNDVVEYTVPADVTRQVVSGLEPGGGYTVTVESGQVSVQKGGAVRADEAGVVIFPPDEPEPGPGTDGGIWLNDGGAPSWPDGGSSPGANDGGVSSGAVDKLVGGCQLGGAGEGLSLLFLLLGVGFVARFFVRGALRRL